MKQRRTFLRALGAGALAAPLAPFALVINARSARALGLKIPQSLLITAEKVIE